MRIAAIVPTRNRADVAARAVASFQQALLQTGLASEVFLTVVDDSDDAGERERLHKLIVGARAGAPQWRIEVLEHHAGGTSSKRSIVRPGGGPGAVRNRGLNYLRDEWLDHDAVVFFDDDISFTSVNFGGSPLQCDGAQVLAEAIKQCRVPRVIVGSPYLGRQDLSMLEHLRLAEVEKISRGSVPPATHRESIQNVAPAGISTAFLAVAGSTSVLPDFAEHYNEDYLWLRGLQSRGWNLKRTEGALIHAPPGPVRVSAEGLSFEVFGEIVWLAVLEQERFSLSGASGVAAAIAEILSDVRAAIPQVSAKGELEILTALRRVLDHYDRARCTVESGHINQTARRLLAAIHAGRAAGIA